MSGVARRAVAGAVAIAVIAGLVGWIVGRQSSPPASTESSSGSVRASLLTVPVESRTLSRDVVTRADATYGDEVEVTVIPDTASGRRPIVTGKVPADDTDLAEGDVMIEIAGRPVFLLDGALPTFRSITPGASGVDVEQLETSLSRLGFFDGTPDDFYDEATEQAVTRLYESAGYSRPEIPPEELDRLRGAEEQVDFAEEQVEIAQEAVDLASRTGTSQTTGRTPVSALAARFNDNQSSGSPELDAAYANWVAAQQRYNDGIAQAEERRQLRLANPGICPDCTLSPDEEFANTHMHLSEMYNAAYAEYQDAYWAAGAGNADFGSGGIADGGQDPSQGEFDQSGDGLDSDGLDSTDSGAGDGVDQSQFVGGDVDQSEFADGADPSQGSGDPNQLPEDFDQSQVPDGSTATDPNAGALDSSEFDPNGGGAVSPTIVSDGRQERRQLDRAKEALTEAQVKLSEARAEVGVSMPQSEFYFLPGLPRTVTEVAVELGDFVDGPVMTISGGGLTFSGGIAEISRPYVKVGDTAMIDDEASGSTITVTITELADSPGTEGQGADRYYFEAIPEDEVADVDELIRIGNFRMVIPIERTEGEVIAVPLAALSAAPDGSSRVEVERDNGSTEFVDVVVGLEAEGYVEVTPVEADAVAVDDLVVIGIDNGTSES